MLKATQKRLQKLRFGWFWHTKTRTKNVAKTCRYYGISRQTYYKWFQRYQKSGKSGLVDRYRKPLRPPPWALNLATRRIIKNLRLNHRWGSGRIKRWLARYYNVIISTSAIYKVLKKYKINRRSLIIKSKRDKIG